jgi:hypothetical protein
VVKGKKTAFSVQPKASTPRRKDAKFLPEYPAPLRLCVVSFLLTAVFVDTASAAIWLAGRG